MVRNMPNSEQIRDIRSRRKLERYELITLLPVSETLNNTSFGDVVNINTEGVGIMCSARVGKGQSYSLRIALPNTILGQDWFDAQADCMCAIEHRESGETLA